MEVEETTYFDTNPIHVLVGCDGNEAFCTDPMRLQVQGITFRGPLYTPELFLGASVSI